jgi:hypothetical protein
MFTPNNQGSSLSEQSNLRRSGPVGIWIPNRQLSSQTLSHKDSSLIRSRYRIAIVVLTDDRQMFFELWRIPPQDVSSQHTAPLDIRDFGFLFNSLQIGGDHSSFLGIVLLTLIK